MAVGLNHEAHRDVLAALRRAGHDDRVESARPSDLVKLASLVCILAGLVIGGPASMVAFGAVGGLALWLALRHDDNAVARGIEEHFDEATGLPLASAIDVVLRDDLIASSLSGRLAVVAVEIPEISAREVAGQRTAAEALMVSTIHRLQSQGWIDRVSGPFGPLLFLRRPGVFLVVLRDVLDDRTTRWLAGRLIDVVNAPVRWEGHELEPRAVMGVAVGRTAQREDLVRRANDARQQARLQGAGTVVSAPGDGPEAHARGELVSVGNRAAVGRIVESRGNVREMFSDMSAALRAVDEAIDKSALTGERWFVRASAAALCHWRLPAGIATKLNAAPEGCRIGLVIPSDLTDRNVRIAWRNIQEIRSFGVAVYIDRSAEAEAAPVIGVDGFVSAGTAETARAGVLEAPARLLAHAEPAGTTWPS